ncbi:MAG: sigma-70 family RNA polymerase sigma factor [Acidobacteria bacterium]|nr:sigma-70 family RNA polymerase sigma factor [Acidobacteriota bacterium]
MGRIEGTKARRRHREGRNEGQRAEPTEVSGGLRAEEGVRALSSSDARKLFEKRLTTIERVIEAVGRRHAMSREDLEDFGSKVKVFLLEDGCAPLRAWRGEARFATFLTVLVVNRYRDFCHERWGRWRSSKLARSLGVDAEQLETLLYRDGFRLDEAVRILCSRGGTSVDAVTLGELAEQLPPRSSRRFEDDSRLELLPHPSSGHDPVEVAERLARRRRIFDALREALGTLEERERRILELRYSDGLRLNRIAVILGVGQRRLYHLHDRSLGRLRHRLEAAGLSWDEVASTIGWDPEDRER